MCKQTLQLLSAPNTLVKPIKSQNEDNGYLYSYELYPKYQEQYIKAVNYSHELRNAWSNLLFYRKQLAVYANMKSTAGIVATDAGAADTGGDSSLPNTTDTASPSASTSASTSASATSSSLKQDCSRHVSGDCPICMENIIFSTGTTATLTNTTDITSNSNSSSNNVWNEEETALIITTCGHSFHAICLKAWMKKRRYVLCYSTLSLLFLIKNDFWSEY